MVDRLALIGDLQAALTHTEVHGIHVDEPWIRFVIRSLCHISLFILENWYFYVHFRPSSLPNGFDETRKPRVWVNSLVNYKPALAGVIDGGEVSFVVLDLLCQLFVIELNVISGSQRWCVWK